MEPSNAKWNALGNFFVERFMNPWKHPEFIIYFILILIVFGGVSIWFTIFIESSKVCISHNSIIVSIFGYAIPVISAGAVDLIFTQEKYLKNSIRLIAFCIVPLAILALLLCFNSNSIQGYIFAILTTIVAWLVWWIANSDNANLCDNSFFQEQSKKAEELSTAIES
jgi:hypothetical protein